MRALIAVPTIVLILSGCGLAPNSASGQTQQADQQTPASTPIGSPSTPADLPVLAHRSTAADSIPIDVAVRELSVDGQVMTLTFSATNRSDSRTWQVADFFNNESNTEHWTVSGVAILDGNNAKRYLPARTADNHCMCSSNLLRANIGPGQQSYFSAVFQAVPEAVTSVSVVIPNAGTFTKIPVNR